MKKIVVWTLCLMLALTGIATLAEDNTKTSIGTVNVSGAFELRCALPEGYAIIDSDALENAGILTMYIQAEDGTRPIMFLYIAFDELLAEVDRLNDLDEDALKQIEATFTEQDDVEITYTETAYGTKLMVVREASEDVDFVDVYTIYKGYQVEFTMVSGTEATEPLSEEQIQMAVDFLSELDFVEVSGS